MPSAMRVMVRPTATEMSPDTPVSISSKMTVGHNACTALMASIRRDSSPPLATLAMSRISPPLLALKRNATAS